MEAESYNEILTNLAKIDYINIKKTNEGINDYFIIDDMKIRNDFSEFKKSDNSNFYVMNIGNNEKTAFLLSKDVSLIEMLKKDYEVFGINDNINKIKPKNVEKYLKDNNINNDIDILTYLANKKKLNIFNSLNEIVNTLNIYNFGLILLPSVKSVTMIDGDYNGFIFNYNYNYNVNEVNIYKDNKRYILTFINNDYFNDDYIIKLISTLEID